MKSPHATPPHSSVGRAGFQLVDKGTYAYLLEGYRALVPMPATLEPGLASALRDQLSAPGSLARAQLAYSIASGCAGGPASARELAVAIEYFHTASLVFDDLPCMDDARERRGRPCTHVRHGESSAVLAALSLITRAYGLLWRLTGRLPATARRRAANLVEECLGASGILDGQARDLACPPNASAAAVAKVAYGKTVLLIRLTLLLPAIARGMRSPALRQLERLAEAWGYTYQGLDDFKDLLCAAEESGKTPGRDASLGRPNYVIAAGADAARRALHRHLADARRSLERLGDECPAALDRLQAFFEGEAARIDERFAVPA